MKHEREYTVQQRTTEGWEDVDTSTTRADALRNLALYRQNDPTTPARIVVVRVPIIHLKESE